MLIVLIALRAHWRDMWNKASALSIFLWCLVVLSCAVALAALVVAPVWVARISGQSAPRVFSRERAHVLVVLGSAGFFKLIVMATLASVEGGGLMRKRQVGLLMLFGAALLVEFFVFGLAF